MEKEDIKNFIKELIEKTNVTVKDISIAEEDGKNTWFRVEITEPHLFTARGGEALSALNHLVRRVIESKNPRKENVGEHDDYGYFVDINGFQKERIEALRAVAHMMAERARYFKSRVEVDPMPAFDRRVVHEFLSTATDLKTESEGVGPARRVVIKYIGTI